MEFEEKCEEYDELECEAQCMDMMDDCFEEE